ncbi:rhodanese-like domain-containing protein [Desulfoluna sp.]|uniref:rhodanese-like domain-containing protein n=1 Tax=Desulfoluna sp. TaxID=2045199 RepID=UPI0026240B8C|nr:rhodanese-like domain-containing protein [Desulfoluna sp.]
MHLRIVASLLLLVFLHTPAAVALAESPGVPLNKQTNLGLYLTATEAWTLWQAHPEQTIVLDVRTQEEYMLVGHAPMARNIPVMFLEPTWERIAMTPNSDFISQIKNQFKQDALLLLMCRSGGRSAMAVNALAEVGFTRVYNIIDGFEGDKIRERGHNNDGKRMLNGWKNAGAPWTYDLDPALLYLP